MGDWGGDKSEERYVGSDVQHIYVEGVLMSTGMEEVSVVA